MWRECHQYIRSIIIRVKPFIYWVRIFLGYSSNSSRNNFTISVLSFVLTLRFGRYQKTGSMLTIKRGSTLFRFKANPISFFQTLPPSYTLILSLFSWYWSIPNTRPISPRLMVFSPPSRHVPNEQYKRISTR